ncbi:WD and tetratricopeptide repeats protein 1-like protein [Aphelenchoides avenae]|nr:WD and tetratricopeptide repeats protein 1-like protein [Aphelenchus avenae]
MNLVQRVNDREARGLDRSFEKDFLVTDEHVQSLQHSYTLEGHEGCVNTITWNRAGTLLASGSDDQHIILWDEAGRLKQRIQTAHTNNIFSVQFLPCSSDRLLVSAAGDAAVLLHDVDNIRHEAFHIQRWECKNRVKRLAVTPQDPRLFWSASEDGELRQFDARDNSMQTLLDVHESHQLKSLAVNDSRPEQIALALSDPMVPIYDRRCMKEPFMKLLPALTHGAESLRPLRSTVTHVAFSQPGDELIANIGGDQIYIYSLTAGNEQQPDLLSELHCCMHDENPGSSRALKGTELFDDVRVHAKSCFRTKQYSKAIDLYSKAINVCERLRDNEGDLTVLLLNRGLCYQKRDWPGDSMASVRDLVHALRLDSGNKKAHYNLIRSLVTLKQYSLAKQCSDLYLKRFPGEKLAESLTKDLGKETDANRLWTREKVVPYRDYATRLCGHVNTNTDIKESNFFGGRDKYVVAGSDCGSLFVWDRRSAEVVRLLQADEHILNCVQPHPTRCLIATSGIENVIRFWEPASTALKKPEINEEEEGRDLTPKVYEICERNQKRNKADLWDMLFANVDLAEIATRGVHAAEGPEGEGGPRMVQCPTQ